MTEKEILNSLMVTLSRMGCRFFRNNIGKAWTGEAVRYSHQQFVKVMAGDVVVRAARRIHYGVPLEGGADLLGWTPVIVTQEMVGKTVAIFSAIEVKTPGVYATPMQRNFLQAVIAAGGKAGIARSVDEGIKITE